MSSDYDAFVATKKRAAQLYGRDPGPLSDVLFDFQSAIVRWACKRGRAAIFADCGMGKTLMQIEWLRHMAKGKRGLIVAPLSVAYQTVREADKLGITTDYRRSDDGWAGGIVVTNYEHAHKFGHVEAVVLDESSILKNYAGKTRTALIEQFATTPYRLACTATPSPNDHAELTNHAEFLGIASRVEVLANFFVHDEDGWRIKGHAKTAFYDWVATWAVSCRRPSDLGYADDGFDLPPLNMDAVVIESPRKEGLLFAGELAGVQGRATERRATMAARVEAAAAVANATDEQVIVWCAMNEESKRLAAAIPDAVEVVGTDKPEDKERAIVGFIKGESRVLVTKPSIAGFGLNLQNCHRMVFVGLSDSYEMYYQSIRRCYRFGQTEPVDVIIVHTEAEGAVVDNVKRKESDAVEMSAALVERCAAVSGVARGMDEDAGTMNLPTWDRASGEDWSIIHGDCVVALREMEEESIDFTVFSPPFATLYTYSDSPYDMGNSADFDEFAEHFRYFPSELLRVVKPGRIAAVHVAQITAKNASDGYIGIKDFRGLVLSEFKRAGWIHHGEITIDKCPQAQAIRTKSKSLLFVQKERDSSWLRPALADYVLVFRKPGDNAVPIQNDDVTRDDWIEWARPVWYGIRESDTLNAAEARGDDDERHVCPLQLGLINRCIRLWSNKGETVLSPFAGVGSEGYVAIECDRRFLGVELKREYFETARKNLAVAEANKCQGELFA